MDKIEQYKEELTKHAGEELTTNFLSENLGVTKHFISELIEQGILKRVSRGVYKVIGINKENEHINANNKTVYTSKEYFDEFKDCILSDKYTEAYNVLINCVESEKDNHDYDNHYYLYFILLTYIMKQKRIGYIQYNYESKLLLFSEESKTKYFDSFISFRDAVLSKDYESASRYLEEYANKERQRYNGNKLSTNIFLKLFETINIILKNKRITSAKVTEIFNLVHQDKLEDAIALIHETKPYFNSDKYQRVMDCLEKLCQKVIDFKKDDTLILPDQKQYDFTGSESAARVFYTFMENEDYLSARSYVETCCNTYKNTYYSIARDLLRELIMINKTHKANLYGADEITLLRKSISQDDTEAKRYFCYFLSNIKKLDFELALENIKKSLSYEKVKWDRQFRSNYYKYMLLKQLIEMRQNGSVLESHQVTYLSDDSYNFNLRKAISEQDYEGAKKILVKMGFNSSLNLEIYYVIINAILIQDKINRGIALTDEDIINPSDYKCLKLDKQAIANKNNSKGKIENKEDNVVEDNNETIQGVENQTDNKVNPQELLARIEGLELNFANLCNLIKAKDFETAYALLSPEGKQIQDDTKASIPEEVSTDETLTESEPTSEENVSTADEHQKENSLPEEPNMSADKIHYLEILDSIKDMELNYDNLYNLIDKLEYEKAYNLLQRENSTERVFFISGRLIYHYLCISKGNFKPLKPKPIDLNQDCFKIFFAAISNRDFALAYDKIDDCITYAKEPEEFKLFKIIIKDILTELDRENAMKEYDNIDKELNRIASKLELEDSDIEKSYKLLSRKIEIAELYNLNYNQDVLVLGVVEPAMMALNKCLNNYYPADVTDTNISDEYVNASIEVKSKQSADLFYTALKYGDFITASKLLLVTNRWGDFLKKVKLHNLMFLKKLFIYIDAHMSIVNDQDKETNHHFSQELIDQAGKDAYALLDENDKKIYPKAELLKNVRSLVNRQKYTEALGVILDSEVPLAKDDDLIDIIAKILFAKELVKEQSHAIFDEFNTALENYDIDLAYDKIKAYSSYLTSKSIDRDISYHYSRLRVLEKDLKQPNFAEKETIYAEAVRAFSSKDKYNNLQETIRLASKYIEMDKDINYKGYLLRAKAYAKLKKDKEAKADYMKAQSIMKNPESLYALGEYAFNNGDYEKALRYLEPFQAIRPFKWGKVSRMLAICYNSMGEREKAIPYNNHLKHLSYIKK